MPPKQTLYLMMTLVMMMNGSLGMPTGNSPKPDFDIQSKNLPGQPDSTHHQQTGLRDDILVRDQKNEDDFIEKLLADMANTPRGIQDLLDDMDAFNDPFSVEDFLKSEGITDSIESFTDNPQANGNAQGPEPTRWQSDNSGAADTRKRAVQSEPDLVLYRETKTPRREMSFPSVNQGSLSRDGTMSPPQRRLVATSMVNNDPIISRSVSSQAFVGQNLNMDGIMTRVPPTVAQLPTRGRESAPPMLENPHHSSPSNTYSRTTMPIIINQQQNGPFAMGQVNQQQLNPAQSFDVVPLAVDSFSSIDPARVIQIPSSISFLQLAISPEERASVLKHWRQHAFSLNDVYSKGQEFLMKDNQWAFISFLQKLGISAGVDALKRFALSDNENLVGGPFQLYYVSNALLSATPERRMSALELFQNDLLKIKFDATHYLNMIVDSRRQPAKQHQLLQLLQDSIQLNYEDASMLIIKTLSINSEALLVKVASLVAEASNKILAMHLLYLISTIGTSLSKSSIMKVANKIKSGKFGIVQDSLSQFFHSNAWGNSQFLLVENGLISNADIHVFRWAIRHIPVKARETVFVQLLQSKREMIYFDALLECFQAGTIDRLVLTNFLYMSTRHIRQDVFNALIQRFDPYHMGDNWYPAIYWKNMSLKVQRDHMPMLSYIYWHYESKVGVDPDKFFHELRPAMQLGFLVSAPFALDDALIRRFKTSEQRDTFLRRVPQDPIALRAPVLNQVFQYLNELRI